MSSKDIRNHCRSCTSVYLLLTLFLVAESASNSEGTASCDEFARNIAQYSRVESITMNNNEIEGVWTSSSCETYHGPQFVLRKYVISQDGRWHADYHHFKDGWCSQPTFTLIIKGSYRIGARNNLGGHNGDFNARSFVLVPHDDKELFELSKVVKRHCPKAGLTEIRQDRSGKVIIPSNKNFTLTKDVYRNVDCREKLGIHIYTHKIMQIFRDRKTTNINDKLYFGETPTHHSRRSFEPTSYHYSLNRASSNCRVCRKLDMSMPGQAVHLSKKSGTRNIAEEWTSSSCQALSNTFMSRYLKFSNADKHGNRMWKLVYYFFLDSSCKVLSYKIAAQGTYSKPVKSKKIVGSFEVSFNLTDTEITPFEMLIVGSLLAEPEGTCGVSSKWRAGEAQSVKATKGCRLFGISIPSVEYDILKTVRTDNGAFDLYTGQTSTNNILHDRPEKRPTSFQLPLRRCRDVTKVVRVIPTTRTVRTRDILVRLPSFTLPKRYFTSKPRPEKDDKAAKDKTVKETRFDNSSHSDRPSLCLPTMMLSLLCIFSWYRFVL